MEGSTGPAALAGGCPADMRLSEEVLEEKDSLAAGWLIGMRALSGLSSLSTRTSGGVYIQGLCLDLTCYVDC